MSTVVLFMNGVTGEPYDCFKRLVPLTLTGAQVKELIVEVDSREPSCYNLLHSVGNVPISMDTTLDSHEEPNGATNRSMYFTNFAIVLPN